MNLKDGEVIILDDNKEYIVVKRIECNNINYIFLMTAVKPISIVIAKEEIAEDGTISLEPVANPEEAEYVISRFTNIE